ncbi:hypothetical protein D3870_12355 [Noviherbaspirillum cavernae]|uniref:Uncharacterized protein n=1 Tax=Noviherbaspirillum cavernae TaxID=2320862 RepID=A0A418X2L4_9BURK|nr:hypothetical protein [Noviherbaspirillum cavernae]RJG06696.1 hypothetical protein D3870_12355 [Noviherbaspirillum cavernae]
MSLILITGILAIVMGMALARDDLAFVIFSTVLHPQFNSAVALSIDPLTATICRTAVLIQVHNITAALQCGRNTLITLASTGITSASMCC